MPQPPANPKIYHIVHMDKLAPIIAAGHLLSDAVISRRPVAGTTIGMSSIKGRRMTLPVPCHEGTCVGDYVPFYFCPRCIMLYVIHCANHPELAYRGGQEPIIHLQADLHGAIAWANANGHSWAFSLSNAGATYTQFRSNLANLDEVNWPAIAARDFRPADVKEGKQAEFLMHEFFPWELVERIGVISKGIGQQVATIIERAAHRPPIEFMRNWYY